MPIIIVNADDLGASEAVNHATFELMQFNVVTSATIIANAPAFEEAVRLARHFPGCSFGAHLNLTVFRPLSASKHLEPILDERGDLSERLFNVGASASLLRALEEELILQVERIHAAGVTISHFDSHQHVHMTPRLFPVLKALQRRFGIRKVRCPVNLLPLGRRAGALGTMKKKVYNLGLRGLYHTRSPQVFGEFRDFHARLVAGCLDPFKVMELMVHPGTTFQPYNDEVALLCSEWLHLLPPDVRLGSYALV